VTTHSPSMIGLPFPVRLAHLFLRSRRAGWAALYLIGIAALIAGLRFLDAAVWASERNQFHAELVVAMQMAFVPLAAALVIGVGAHGPFGELERTVSRSLPVLRSSHLAALLLT
jgi:hypothetical protein